MKKFLSLAIIALLTVTAFSQNNTRKGNRQTDMTPDEVAEMQTNRMAANLDLTDVQKKQVYELNKEMTVKRQEGRKAYPGRDGPTQK